MSSRYEHVYLIYCSTFAIRFEKHPPYTILIPRTLFESSHPASIFAFCFLLFVHTKYDAVLSAHRCWTVCKLVSIIIVDGPARAILAGDRYCVALLLRGI